MADSVKIVLPNGTIVISHKDNGKIGKIVGNYKIGYKIRWSSSKYDYSYRVYLRDFTIKND